MAYFYPPAWLCTLVAAEEAGPSVSEPAGCKTTAQLIHILAITYNVGVQFFHEPHVNEGLHQFWVLTLQELSEPRFLLSTEKIQPQHDEGNSNPWKD